MSTRSQPFAVSDNTGYAIATESLPDLPLTFWKDDEAELPWHFSSQLDLDQLEQQHSTAFMMALRSLSAHMLGDTLVIEDPDNETTAMVLRRDRDSQTGWTRLS